MALNRNTSQNPIADAIYGTEYSISLLSDTITTISQSIKAVDSTAVQQTVKETLNRATSQATYEIQKSIQPLADTSNKLKTSAEILERSLSRAEVVAQRITLHWALVSTVACLISFIAGTFISAAAIPLPLILTQPGCALVRGTLQTYEQPSQSYCIIGKKL